MPDEQEDRKRGLLAYGHYAAAAVTFLFNGFGVLMLVLVAAVMRFAPPKPSETIEEQAIREWMAGVLPWGACLFAVYAIVATASLVYAGILIRRSRGYRLCLWLSAFNVMSTTGALPLGPIAGGFALAHLRKASTQDHFVNESPREHVGFGARWDLKVLSMVATLLCAQTLLGLAVFGTFLVGMLNLAPSGATTGETEQLELIRFAAPFFLASLALYSLVVVSGLGYLLARVERRGLCVALSIAALFYVPMGTLLGVFTLLVLNRSDTRALFDGVQEHGRPAVR